MNGVQTIDPNLVTTLATHSMMGTSGYSDLQKIYDKLTNDRLPYSLPDEVAAVIEGKPLEVIQSTSAVANDIDSILGPGASANADLESIANEREANPFWYAETYIPSLEEAFAAKYPQYKDTNVNKYSTAAPQWRYEWKNLVGQDADEQSAVWTQFISTNDIKEREDIAFKYAAEIGTQTYQDKVVADLEGVFGQPGQRVTGGTMWNSRVK